jgi:signal transduction histidine kinase
MHSTLQFAPLVIAAGLLGGLWGSRSRKLAVERSEAEAARREHDQRITRAEQAERERIAQELHDVAAQHLSGLLSLANAAVDLADDDPHTAVSLIADVREEGRFAVASIYGALGELRSRGAEHPEPTPDAQQLDRLVGQWRARGMRVELLALGDLTTLPAVVSVTAYRTVQEALANAAKHAPGAHVRVRVLVDVARLSLTVENAAPARSASASASGNGIGLGWGLSGLRQRLTFLNGTLRAGPATDGGWRVSVDLPLTQPEATGRPAQWAP